LSSKHFFWYQISRFEILLCEIKIWHPSFQKKIKMETEFISIACNPVSHGAEWSSDFNCIAFAAQQMVAFYRPIPNHSSSLSQPDLDQVSDLMHPNFFNYKANSF
jgi:hypothetical protein